MKCVPSSHVTHPCSAGLSSRILRLDNLTTITAIQGKLTYRILFMLLCFWVFAGSPARIYLALRRRRCGLYSGLGRVCYARLFFSNLFKYYLNKCVLYRKFSKAPSCKELYEEESERFNGNQMSWNRTTQELLKSVLIELSTEQYSIHYSSWMILWITQKRIRAFI